MERPTGKFLLQFSEGQNYRGLEDLGKKGVLRLMGPEKGLWVCYVYKRTPEVL